MNTFNKFVLGIMITTLMGGAYSALAKEKTGKGALDAMILLCVQKAIDNRDNAILMGLDVYYPAAKTALQTRQAALKNAWTQTDQKIRKDVIKTIWKSYKNSAKSARTAMKGAQKVAWKKFEADRKACSPKAAGDDNGSLGIDSQL